MEAPEEDVTVLKEALEAYKKLKAASRRRKMGTLKESIPAATPIDDGSPLRVNLEISNAETAREGVEIVGKGCGAATGENAMDGMGIAGDTGDGEDCMGAEQENGAP